MIARDEALTVSLYSPLLLLILRPDGDNFVMWSFSRRPTRMKTFYTNISRSRIIRKRVAIGTSLVNHSLRYDKLTLDARDVDCASLLNH